MITALDHECTKCHQMFLVMGEADRPADGLCPDCKAKAKRQAEQERKAARQKRKATRR